MPLKAYEEVVGEPLAFPINGKIYTPPPISAKAGIYLVRALAGDPGVSNEPSQSMWKVLLGPVYDEMIADNVPMDALARAGFAMLVDWQNNDRAAAERVWESGIDPEARAALAAAILQTTQPSTPPAAANTTRTPASGTGTRTTARKKPAKRTTSSRSSRTGRSS